MNFEFHCVTNCNDLLDGWYAKNLEKIKEKLLKDKNKLIEKDMVASDLRSIIDDFNEKVEAFQENYISYDTKEEIEKLYKKFEELSSDLIKIRDEVKIAMSICETEDSLRKVLKAYNIIDKDGKIKVK